MHYYKSKFYLLFYSLLYSLHSTKTESIVEKVYTYFCGSFH